MTEQSSETEVVTTEPAQDTELDAIVESLEVAEPPAEQPAETPAVPVLPAAEAPLMLPEAPAPTAEPAPVAEPAPAAASEDSVPTWPFVTYVVLWALFAGVLVWRFIQIPEGQAVFDSPVYPLSVFGGLALAVAGPLVVLASWLSSLGIPGASKGGLFVSAFLKGAIATLMGVSLWWLALLIVDQVRLGRIL